MRMQKELGMCRDDEVLADGDDERDVEKAPLGIDNLLPVKETQHDDAINQQQLNHE